jgi:hypothetical protein
MSIRRTNAYSERISRLARAIQGDGFEVFLVPNPRAREAAYLVSRSLPLSGLVVLAKDKGLVFIQNIDHKNFRFEKGLAQSFNQETLTWETEISPFLKAAKGLHEGILPWMEDTLGQKPEFPYGGLVCFNRLVCASESSFPACFPLQSLLTAADLENSRAAKDRIFSFLATIEGKADRKFSQILRERQLQILGARLVKYPENPGAGGGEGADLILDTHLKLFASLAQPKVTVKGPAGSGKTLLALALAERNHASGVRKTVYLCKSFLLRSWLKLTRPEAGFDIWGPLELLKALRSRITCFPEGWDDDRVHDDNEEQEVEKLIIDLLAHDQANKGESRGWLDCLVIDEAQDFSLVLRNRLMNLVSNDGFCQFFYDPDQEVARDFKAIDSRELPILSLDTNCRNPKKIAELSSRVSRLIGATAIKSPVWMPVGDEPDVELFAPPPRVGNEAELLGAKIKAVLEVWLREGVTPSDIAVLTGKGWKDSCLKDLGSLDCGPPGDPARDSKVPLVPGKDESGFRDWILGEAVIWAPVAAFKGLEATHVLLVEPWSSFPEALGPRSMKNGALLYVAVTRARRHLTILSKDGNLYKFLRELTQ